MKVPPKRKGNLAVGERECMLRIASMKVPPKRKGNLSSSCRRGILLEASMKVPPKRKGNDRRSLPLPFTAMPQ